MTKEFVQYADNVDHNNRSLDEHDTFHIMSMVAADTPGTRSNKQIPSVHVTSLKVVLSMHDTNHHLRTAPLVEGFMTVRSEPLVGDLRRICLRLDGFHSEMCFICYIGHVMASSGLQ